MSVTLPGTRFGTATDINGQYRLNIPEQSQMLKFSGAGFETREVPINNQRVINVVLKRDSTQQPGHIVVTEPAFRRQSVSGTPGTRILNKELIAGKPINQQVICNKGAGIITSAKKPDTIAISRKQHIKQSNP